MTKVDEALRLLKKASAQKDRDNLVRFGINAKNALGVSMKNIQAIAKTLGRSHELAGELWASGCYEARMLTAFVDEVDLVTSAQMDRWCNDFDNWGIADTMCFCLWDRTPHAWAKVAKWSTKRDEFGKRAAFAMLASLAGHDKKSGDEPFLKSLPLVERAASDDRNFVKKGVSWSLRGTGRRSAVLHAAAMEVAKRLAESKDAAPRWVGKDALRDLVKHPPRKSG
jgi:3-methyladenine DNA glycosylase AlkD